MAARLRMKHSLPNSPANKTRMIESGLTIQRVIAVVAKLSGADSDQVMLYDCILYADQLIDDCYESRDRLFAFSKASAAAVARRLTFAIAFLAAVNWHCGNSAAPFAVTAAAAASTASGPPASAYVRGFRGCEGSGPRQWGVRSRQIVR
jgi:hypothetical protein